MNWLAWWNLFEALWWFCVAAVAALAALKANPPRRGRLYTAAVLLFAFGISDCIECSTGAWWRPFWLLILKAICLIGLIAVGICSLRSRASDQHDTDKLTK